MIVAVTGGRDIEPTERELEALMKFCHEHKVDEVRHGECAGVDRAVANAAWDQGIRLVIPYPAHWDALGFSAGPIRNHEMLRGKRAASPDPESLADVLVAWKGGRGTAHCKKAAGELGIEVIEIEKLEKEYMGKKKEQTKLQAVQADVIPFPDLSFIDQDEEQAQLEDDYEVLLDFEIDDAGDHMFAVDELKAVKKELKTWEAKEKSVTSDLSSALKKIRDLFRPKKKLLQQCEKLWKQKIIEWQEKLHAAEERALREAAAASKAGNKAEARAKLELAQESTVSKTEGITTKYTYDYEIVDMAAVPREYLAVDDAKVKAVIKAHKGDVEIPGIKVVRKATIAATV